MKGIRRSAAEWREGARCGRERRRLAGPRRLPAILGLAAAVACAGDGPASSRSSVTLVVERIGAASDGDGRRTRPGPSSGRDVVTGGTVTPDAAQVTLRLAPKDPGTGQPVRSAPSGTQFATVDRYRVRYVRSDGLAHAGRRRAACLGRRAGGDCLGRRRDRGDRSRASVREARSAAGERSVEGGGDVVINVMALRHVLRARPRRRPGPGRQRDRGRVRGLVRCGTDTRVSRACGIDRRRGTWRVACRLIRRARLIRHA